MPKTFLLAALPLSLAFASLACGGASPADDGSSEEDALKVCATGDTLKGVDVSYYQQRIDWAQVKAAGTAFAFVRVSDGTKFADPKFAENWGAVREAGLVRGVYQYFRASEDPAAQARLLLEKVGTLEPDDMPPVLDVEETEGVSPLHLQQRVHTWLTTIEQATGRKPVVYTMAAMSGSIGNAFTEYPLWVANWGVSCPRMPSKWSAWKFWQKTDKGTVAGIHAKVDMDVFNGTMADLQAFIVETGGGAPSTKAHEPDNDAGADDPDAGDLFP